MNASGFPVWAKPYPGESRASWLAATGALQPIARPQWEGMWVASHNEPERPVRGELWQGLPDCLGMVKAIPACWRLGPEHRDVYCDDCKVVQNGTVRWPTCIEWLDARRIVCSQHNRLLVYRTVPSVQSTDIRELLPEVDALCAWLLQWIELEQQCLEAHWRRDLVHMCMRNWNHVWDHGPAASIGWELISSGWALPADMPVSAPNGPARLGSLPPTARLSSLMLAYRCACHLDGATNVSAQLLSQSAWQWLYRRWRCRHPQRAQQIREHLKQIENRCGRRHRQER